MADKHVTWTGIIGTEARPTGDGRYIVDGALRWEDLPLPLRYSREDVGGHDGAIVVGTIDEITRADSGMIEASGRFDMGSDEGREAYRQVSEGMTTGVSMDLDDVSFEVRISGEVADELEAQQSDQAEGEPAGLTRNEDGTATVVSMGPDDEVQWVTEGRIRAATIVAIPAFKEAQLIAVEGQTADDVPEHVAASAATGPPTAWFANPKFTGPTALTVEDDGRVYGHLALWGTCHVGLPSCQTPPASSTAYMGYTLGSVRCADGTDQAVGNITMGTGHAGDKLSATQAIRHYDDTGTQVARVASGEDEHGIWIAGYLRPGVSDEQIEQLRASPLSGDWRRQGTGLELVAVLAVNVPGFPVPRPAARVASGSMYTLVAAGMLRPARELAGGLSVSDVALLRQAANRERSVQAAQMCVRASVARRAVALDHAARLSRRVKAGV